MSSGCCLEKRYTGGLGVASFVKLLGVLAVVVSYSRILLYSSIYRSAVSCCNFKLVLKSSAVVLC